MKNQKINYIPDVMSEWDCTVLDYMSYIDSINKIRNNKEFQQLLNDIKIERLSI